MTIPETMERCREMLRYRFDFPGDGAVFVPPDRLYMPQKAPGTAAQTEGARADGKDGAAGGLEYGFLTEENRRREKRLAIPELNSGFDAAYWCSGQELTALKADDRGVCADWKGAAELQNAVASMGQLPLTFVSEVPAEGNYLVRVVLEAAETGTMAQLFLGRRRLAWRGVLEAGRQWTGSFVTNICPIIPRTYENPMEDLTIDITVVGQWVHLAAVEIEPWSGRTLYIAGDSTVTDQSADYPYMPYHSYCGWGQMLPAFCGMQYAVSNHAHSGLTTESFREEGHYAILYERLREGDVCLMQFGHNDQKLAHLLADGGYRENIIRYIEEIRGKKAVPVLVTPLARNSWRGDDGGYNDLLAPYADVCIRLADEYGVPLVDLHRRSAAFIQECGRECAMRYFFPDDYTHGNDYGAYRFAGYVYEELIRAGVMREAVSGGSESGMESDAVCSGTLEAAPGGSVVENEAGAASPPAWEPPEVLPQFTVPEAFAGIKNPADAELFAELERPDEMLTRVEALELAIEALHFFPTNVYNDMFEDIIGHERYAGAVQCAWQNGLIPAEMAAEHHFFPQRNIKGAEFYQILKNAYKSRRTWTDACEQILPGLSGSGEPIRRGVAAELCRRLVWL